MIYNRQTKIRQMTGITNISINIISAGVCTEKRKKGKKTTTKKKNHNCRTKKTVPIT